MAKDKTPAKTETPVAPAFTPKKKADCPITRAQFEEKAIPMKVKIGEDTKIAGVKDFSSGSFGWCVSEKAVIEVDGIPLNCQVGLNITVIGSKDLPK